MNHMDDSQLLALLDGELSRAAVERVREHLDDCDECHRRYRELEERSRLFSEGAALLDESPREAGWNEVMERARAESRDGRDREVLAGSPGRAVPFLKAAAILLVATGAAAAIPGSPVDDWIGEAANRITGWIGGEAETVETRAPDPGAEDRSTPGVAVSLEGGKVIVALSETAPGTEVEVSLVSGRDAEVEARGARYRTGPGRIEAVGASGDRIRIRVPRVASSARVLVGGEPAVVLQESGRLRVLLDGGTESGSAVSFRIPDEPSGG